MEICRTHGSVIGEIPSGTTCGFDALKTWLGLGNSEQVSILSIDIIDMSFSPHQFIRTALYIAGPTLVGKGSIITFPQLMNFLFSHVHGTQRVTLRAISTEKEPQWTLAFGSRNMVRESYAPSFHGYSSAIQGLFGVPVVRVDCMTNSTMESGH
jgi:hypothetical protein